MNAAARSLAERIAMRLPRLPENAALAALRKALAHVCGETSAWRHSFFLDIPANFRGGAVQVPGKKAIPPGTRIVRVLRVQPCVGRIVPQFEPGENAIILNPLPKPREHVFSIEIPQGFTGGSIPLPEEAIPVFSWVVSVIRVRQHGDDIAGAGWDAAENAVTLPSGSVAVNVPCSVTVRIAPRVRVTAAVAPLRVGPSLTDIPDGVVDAVGPCAVAFAVHRLASMPSQPWSDAAAAAQANAEYLGELADLLEDEANGRTGIPRAYATPGILV